MANDKQDIPRKLPKPWTASKGKIIASAYDLRKAQAINDLLMTPAGLLPTQDGEWIRPFQIGLWEELRPMIKPDTAVVKLRRAISAYTHSKNYVFATAQPDAMRHDIDGQPVEPVSDSNRHEAQLMFLELAKRRRVDTTPDGMAANSDS